MHCETPWFHPPITFYGQKVSKSFCCQKVSKRALIIWNTHQLKSINSFFDKYPKFGIIEDKWKPWINGGPNGWGPWKLCCTIDLWREFWGKKSKGAWKEKRRRNKFVRGVATVKSLSDFEVKFPCLCKRPICLFPTTPPSSLHLNTSSSDSLSKDCDRIWDATAAGSSSILANFIES